MQVDDKIQMIEAEEEMIIEDFEILYQTIGMAFPLRAGHLCGYFVSEV